MNSALALAVALAFTPAQAGSLNVTNVRQTYGELGATRPDQKYMPLDFVWISFDIEGLKASPEGRVSYRMGMDVLDKTGKAFFSAPPAKQDFLLPCGAARLPAFVFVTLGSDMPVGSYTAKVTVVDVVSNASKTFEQKFEVQATQFGLVGHYVTKDMDKRFACGMTGIVGQTVYLNFDMIGFGRDATGKTNAAVEFRMLDEKNQPLNPQPIVVAVPRELDAKALAVPFQIELPLNREGSFTVELKAADKVTNKSATVTLPIRIHPASK